jgi:hypothetical protein
MYNPRSQKLESLEEAELDLQLQDLIDKRDWINAEIKALESKIEFQQLLDKVQASKGV